MPQALEIFLGDRHAGTITNLTSDHNVFTFDPQYANDDDRPVLSLGFYNAKGELSANARPPQVRLLPFFSNLLPEGHLRQYIADNANVNPKRDFPLLWLLGEDLPGAVIARHADGEALHREESPAVLDPAIEDNSKVLKFSLAGVQLKFSAIMEARDGLTIPAHGQGGRWIVKMPSATYAAVPENEYTMLTFARRVGIEVPEIGLVDSANIVNMPPQIRTDLGNAMYIKRFDRDGDRRIHIEDFAQIFNQYPQNKYDNVSYANILQGIWRAMGEEQSKEFVRRLVFSIAIGNADMHLKNWSVIYPDDKTPKLAPAYDYVSTVVYIENDKLALTIARTKEWELIDNARLERFARRAGVPSGIVLNAAHDMVNRIKDEWAHLDDQQLLSTSMKRSVNQHIARVPLFSDKKVHALKPASEPTAALETEIA